LLRPSTRPPNPGQSRSTPPAGSSPPASRSIGSPSAPIHSTVHEFEPAARIGWYGQTDQWLAYHTWLLEPRDESSTYVVMEETGTGANPRKLANTNPGHMHRGHDLWNISLKFLCESTRD
jgi:hypothetical protein